MSVPSLRDLFKPETFWAWAESEDSEQWEGPFATKDEAIDHGHENAIVYGQHDELTSYGFLSEAHWPDPEGFVEGAADADDILETMNEQDEVAWSDDPVFEMKDRDVARLALEGLLREWAREYVKADGWCVTGEPEAVPPPAPEATA